MHRTIVCLTAALILRPSPADSQTPCAEAYNDGTFHHGVASGDATSDAVILWTRISVPETTVPVCVSWRIGLTEDLITPLGSGTIITDSERDFTVKVEAMNLPPDTWLYYRFTALGFHSETGRTKTLPDGPAEIFKAAVFSCSNYELGYFNAYRHAAEANAIEAVFHLGDYYYEGINSSALPDRHHEPDKVLYTLSDYRTRHAQTCSDPDARTLRRQYPWYVLWDDHEFSDDAWEEGAYGHLLTESGWADRVNASKRAYFEWMPIRERPDSSVYRSFDIGDLARLIFVDDRIEGRSEPVAADSPLVDDTTRTILGATQRQWLFDRLSESGQTWKPVAGGVLKTPAVTEEGYPIDPDLWEGYRADRDRLFQHVQDNTISGLLSLAGDFHSSWASDLAFGEYSSVLQTGSVGCELVTCAVTSDPHTVGDIDSFMGINPHVRFIEQTSNGYLNFQLTHQELMASWTYISTRESRDFEPLNGQAVRIVAGNPYIQLVDEVWNPEPNQASLAKLAGIPSIASGLNEGQVFPNPADSHTSLIWFGACTGAKVMVYDAAGRAVLIAEPVPGGSGWKQISLETSTLPDGVYLIAAENGTAIIRRRLVVVHP